MARGTRSVLVAVLALALCAQGHAAWGAKKESAPTAAATAAAPAATAHVDETGTNQYWHAPASAAAAHPAGEALHARATLT